MHNSENKMCNLLLPCHTLLVVYDIIVIFVVLSCNFSNVYLIRLCHPPFNYTYFCFDTNYALNPTYLQVECHLLDSFVNGNMLYLRLMWLIVKSYFILNKKIWPNRN